MIVLGAETHMASTSYIACAKKQRPFRKALPLKLQQGSCIAVRYAARPNSDMRHLEALVPTGAA